MGNFGPACFTRDQPCQPASASQMHMSFPFAHAGTLSISTTHSYFVTSTLSTTLSTPLLICKAVHVPSPCVTTHFLFFLLLPPNTNTPRKKKCLSSVSPRGTPRPLSSVPPPSGLPPPGPSSPPARASAPLRACAPSTRRSPLKSLAPGETANLSNPPTTRAQGSQDNSNVEEGKVMSYHERSIWEGQWLPIGSRSSSGMVQWADGSCSTAGTRRSSTACRTSLSSR